MKTKNQKVKSKSIRVIRVFFLFLSMITLPLIVASSGLAASGSEEQDCLLFSRFDQGYWQIWMKVLDTNQEYPLTFSDSDKKAPQYIKDTPQITYRTANSSLMLLDYQTGESYPMLEGFGFIMDQRISSDGQKIVFTRMRSDILDDSDIVIVDANGDNPFQLTNEPSLQWQPAWFPGGKQLAYVSRSQQSSTGFAVWISDANGENKQQVTSSNGHYDILPAVSPDEKTIVYSSNPNGDYDLWMVDLPTMKASPLEVSAGLDTYPVFSSDGQSVLFTSLRDGHMRIWQRDLKEKAAVPLTDASVHSQDPCACRVNTNMLNIIKERSQK